MPETVREDAAIHLIRLTPDDVKQSTPDFLLFRDRVLENEPMYPGIDRWFLDKVSTGLRSSERAAFVCHADSTIIATAIVKRGESAKFCHLKIDDEYRDRHLGELLFTLMALEVADLAKEIHFTLPEGLWETKRQFFQSFGIKDVTGAERSYRNTERELRCSAPFPEVWRSIQGKMPKLVSHLAPDVACLDDALILSVKPDFAASILNGTKTTEIRKRFHPKWVGHRVCLYASSPVQCIVGEATITSVTEGDPTSIWEEHGPSIHCSRKEFVDYVSSSSKVYAIRLDEVSAYQQKVTLDRINSLLEGGIVAPQSYCSVKPDMRWHQAVIFAALLQKREIEPGSSISEGAAASTAKAKA